MLFGCQSAEESRRIVVLACGGERARLPVAPWRFVRLCFRHGIDGSRHVRPDSCTQSSTRAPCPLFCVLRCTFRVEEPVIRQWEELPRRIVGNEQIAVTAIGLAQAIAPLE